MCSLHAFRNSGSGLGKNRAPPLANLHPMLAEHRVSKGTNPFIINCAECSSIVLFAKQLPLNRCVSRETRTMESQVRIGCRDAPLVVWLFSIRCIPREN